MDQKKKVLIIIPAYNESRNIQPLLKALKEDSISSFCDVLVMNDASTDNTAAIVRKYGFKVISHVFNLGYGAGLQVGYKYATAHDYKYVIQMDADGQHDVKNIKFLYDKLTSADEKGNVPDIVIGSRFLEGSQTFKVGAVKRFAMKLFSRQIRHATGVTITDPTSGLQGLSHRAFAYYQAYSHFDDQYPDANMIMQMLLLGFNVTEVPAIMHARDNGVSMHSGLKPFIYMIRMFFSLIAVRVRIQTFKVDMGAPDRLA